MKPNGRLKLWDEADPAHLAKESHRPFHPPHPRPKNSLLPPRPPAKKFFAAFPSTSPVSRPLSKKSQPSSPTKIPTPTNARSSVSLPRLATEKRWLSPGSKPHALPTPMIFPTSPPLVNFSRQDRWHFRPWYWHWWRRGRLLLPLNLQILNLDRKRSHRPHFPTCSHPCLVS